MGFFCRAAAAPLAIERTGDDRPVAGIWAYVVRMTGIHQLWACLLAVLVALVNLIPIELQRRIVDDAIVAENLGLLLWLAAAYVAALAAHKLLKFALGIYQGWLSESAIIYTRTHLTEVHSGRLDDDTGSEVGKVVSIIGPEADQLGGFVGEGPSQACVNASMLIGVISYMAIVQPQIAVLSIGLLVPQIVAAPILQRRLNRLIERRLALLRDLGDAVADERIVDATEEQPLHRLLRRIFDNRMQFFFWKFLMKALLNMLNALAPLSVLIWGGWLAIEGETTVGVLVAFLSGFERISGPIRGLISFYRTAEQAQVQHAMIARWM